MATKFTYADPDWAKIEPFVKTAGAEVRRKLESAGSRYLLSTLSQARERDPLQKQEWTQRRRIAKHAKALLLELNDNQLIPSDLGMGAFAATVANARDLTARQELEDLRSALGRIVAWLAADEMEFFPKRSSAHKPAKGWLVGKVLGIWEEKLRQKIPGNGGGPSGPTSRYLQAACNPILRLGADGPISTGEQARKLIQSYMEN